MLQWIFSACTADLQNLRIFVYFVTFFRESVAGVRVKQLPRNLQQLEALTAPA